MDSPILVAGVHVGYEGRPLLVVDDDVLVTSSVSRTLRHSVRRPVETANSYRAATELLGSRSDWTCLILDVGLGEDQPTGFDILAMARAKMPSVAAVLLTGLVEPELINRAARLNASYVCKPAGADELVPVVSRALVAESSADPRVAANIDAVLRGVGLESKRSGELLRLAIGGKRPDEVAATMKIGPDGYAHHVTQLLRATGARSLEALVSQILRSALRAP